VQRLCPAVQRRHARAQLLPCTGFCLGSKPAASPSEISAGSYGLHSAAHSFQGYPLCPPASLPLHGQLNRPPPLLLRFLPMPSACMPARTHGQFGFEKLHCSPQRRTQGFLRGSQVRTTAVKQLPSISRQLGITKKF
jgi:hypothetical protein